MPNDAPFKTNYVDRTGLEKSLELESVSRFVCDLCGEEIVDDAATKLIEEARRGAMGLLTSNEIRKLRSRFDRSQIQMSKLLGIGEKTYCRWESGSCVQSFAFDNYLRVLRDVPGAEVALIRLERWGAPCEPITDDVFAEFPSLRNGRTSLESSERFTDLLVAGVLYVASQATTAGDQ